MNIYFSENLKTLRKQRNLTQEALADNLGVTFQAISKWERGEGYPDITTLPLISTFFNVSLDDLLGINKAKNEAELSKMITEYDKINDNQEKKTALDELIQIAPNDYNVLLRELGYLVHFSDINDNFKRIKTIYDNIQQNCRIDRIRISATRHMIIMYCELAKSNDNSISFSDVENMLENMPYMRDGQEFISSYLYPAEHPAYYNKIQEAIEQGIGLVDTSISHYYLYDDNFSIDFKIDMLCKIIDIKNIIYDDGNFGEQWQQIIYDYGHLGHFYFQNGNTEMALIFLKRSAELAKQFDELDRFTTMNSALFKGRIFDKQTLGSSYVAKSRMKYLMENKYPLSADFKKTKEFKEIIRILE